MLIDVHFHPFEDAIDRDTAALMERAAAAGVGMAIAAGVDLESSRESVLLARRLPCLAAAVGWHPWMADPAIAAEPLLALAAAPEVVAIGEIGLDGKVDVDQEVQRRAFDLQLGVARACRLPVIVHSRGAFERTLEVLAGHPGVVGVMHSFGGSVEVARRLLDLGCWFSFSGTVTRANARKAIELARFLPLDRVLLETDAPSIGLEGIPAAQVEPRHLPLMRDAVAALRGLEPAALEAAVERNTFAVFGERLTLLAARGGHK